MMKTSREIYQDYSGKRKGILRALITDVDQFFQQCDPDKDNLVLYAYPDGSWFVDLPVEEVPPLMPEPALGINFARDGMQRKDWLCFVAVHSDAWLMASAFHLSSRLNQEEREELFSMINKLPTCYEVVSEVNQNSGTRSKRSVPESEYSKAPHRKRRQGESEKRSAKSETDVSEDADKWEDGEGDPCPSCNRKYRASDFWIACDKCDTWYCGKCAKMTEVKAQKMTEWTCWNCGSQDSE